MSKKYQARDDTNRSRKITFRLSDDEYEQLSFICDALNLTYSQYLRRAALTAKIERPIVQISFGDQYAKELAAQMGKIGGLLNQIARMLNSGAPQTKQMKIDIARTIDQLNERLRYLRNVEAFNGNLETSERT